MSDTPAPATEPENLSVTDARGRVLKLRVLDPGDSLDLLEAAGPSSGNEGYMRYAMIIASVSAIGDVPLPQARTRDQLRSNARKLGNDGFAAAAVTLFGSASASTDADAAKN